MILCWPPRCSWRSSSSVAFWRRLRKRENNTIILQFVEAGNVEQAQAASESRHPIARVLLAGLEYRRSRRPPPWKPQPRPSCVMESVISLS
jgi:hypothetical protein